MAETQKIVILNFGGQYTQLIARRVRECHVYSCVLPYDASLETIRAQNPVGVILSGGPASVLEQDAPRCDEGVYQLGVPVLGICYGMQLTAYLLGGTVEKAAQREYGRITVTMDDKTSLLSGMSDASSCWLSHTYQVKKCPAGFHPIAHSTNCPVAAMANDDRRIYGVQFHPEVTHSDEGRAVIENFLNICGCVGDWSMETYAQTAIANIREIVGDKGTVLLGLSGGVDSSVAAALIYKAIGDRLTCVYVDHGFMRKGETEQVVNVFTHTFPVRLVASDASKIFYEDLKGVSDPETKRKIIGRDFLKVFKAESEKLGKLDYFAQGTIYPDVIESGQATGAAVIKSHHNVGGLPKELGFTQLIEPLRMLFKDEVRQLGRELGLPEARLPLAEAAILLATAPKSNSAHNAIIAAMDDIRRGRVGQVPRHLQNVHADSTGSGMAPAYRYPHDYPHHYVAQRYLPEALGDVTYYQYGDNKTEQAARRYWEDIKKN